jgi:DNA-binding Lrp family transcriptional regulator
MDIDDLDRAIIAAFHENPRATNRAVAKSVRIAEATVATRIKRLVHDRVLKFTLQRDIRAQGFRYQFIVSVYISGRSAALVAAEVGKLSFVHTAMLMQGAPEVVAFVNTRHRREIIAILSEGFGGIEGIDHLAADVVLDVRKYIHNYAMVRTAPA